MQNDLHAVIAYFITGILIGILFDIFRISRKTFNTPNIVTYIEDILFWILSAMLLLYVIFTFTTGEIRLYMIIMLIIGAIIYFISISKYIILVNTKIIQFIKKALFLVFKPIISVTQKITSIYRKKLICKLKNKKLKKNCKK